MLCGMNICGVGWVDGWLNETLQREKEEYSRRYHQSAQKGIKETCPAAPHIADYEL